VIFLPIACGGPSSGSVDLAVGYGNAVGGAVTEDNVLTGNEVGRNVVNPDHVAAIDGDSITTPYVLRVDISEAYVLDDDVLDTVRHPDALALDDTLGALTNETLVRADSHTGHTSLVVRDAGDLRGLGLVVVAPSVLVDSDLACGSSAPWFASCTGSLALGTSEVEGLSKDNDSRG
jgi:hypothetical protein